MFGTSIVRLWPLTEVNSDAILDTIGSGPGRVSTTPHAKGTLLGGEDLHEVRDLLGAGGHDHTPWGLRSVGRVVRRETSVIRRAVGGKDLPLEARLFGQCGTLGVGSALHSVAYEDRNRRDERIHTRGAWEQQQQRHPAGPMPRR